MFGAFVKKKNGGFRDDDLERFKDITSNPEVVTALQMFDAGISQLPLGVGQEAQECIHLSNTLTSKGGFKSEVLFSASKSRDWDFVEGRLKLFDDNLREYQASVDHQLEELVNWANRFSMPELEPWDAMLYKQRGIPRDKYDLIKLRFINVTEHGITYIPGELSVLPLVQGILLDDNNISHIPEKVCRMQTVFNLSLSGNQLEGLPINIGDMKSLEKVYLDKNNITTIPRSILQLRSLRKLDLRKQKHGKALLQDGTPLDDESISVLSEMYYSTDNVKL